MIMVLFIIFFFGRVGMTINCVSHAIGGLLLLVLLAVLLCSWNMFSADVGYFMLDEPDQYNARRPPPAYGTGGGGGAGRSGYAADRSYGEGAPLLKSSRF